MPGAGGGVGFAHTVTQRNGDEHLLVAASPSTTLNLAQGLYGSLTQEDVRWVAAVAAEYGALAVAADAQWDDFGAFISDWRDNPRDVTFAGGSAVASQDHMKILLLARELGIEPTEVRYVPFDGGGEALVTLLGGFVQVFSGEASELIGHMDAGTVRPLAIFSDERMTGPLDNVPTAKEFGVDLTWVTWRGYYAPAGIPDSVYDNWVELIGAVAESPEWQEELDRSRLQPFFLGGTEFSSFVRDQVANFAQVAIDIGIVR